MVELKRIMLNFVSFLIVFVISITLYCNFLCTLTLYSDIEGKEKEDG